MVFISWVDLMQAVGTEAANSYNGIILLIKNQAVRQVSLRGVKSRVPWESNPPSWRLLRSARNDSIWPLVTEGIPEAFFKQAPGSMPVDHPKKAVISTGS